jgi:hypothetical protein
MGFGIGQAQRPERAMRNRRRKLLVAKNAAQVEVQAGHSSVSSIVVR